MAWTLPPGFEMISGRGAPGVTLIVAARARTALLEAGIDRPDDLSSGPTVAEWVEGGRVRHPVLMAGDERWLLKAYRRGGLFARWNPDLYWSPMRFIRELDTSLRAVRSGVPAPEPIALVLRSAGRWGGFRAWQVVRFLPSVRSLREYLGDAGRPATDGGPAIASVFRAAGEAVRRMHEAEIDHPDLNVGNILAGPSRDTAGAVEPGAAAAYIIDWDRARPRAAGSWNPHRNLLRLWRSALKMARVTRPAAAPDRRAVQAFLRGYFHQNRAGLRSLRGYARRRVADIALHSLIWDLSRIWRAS
jgi:3-deoxy-D-manno-octulosonic acid kinase